MNVEWQDYNIEEMNKHEWIWVFFDLQVSPCNWRLQWTPGRIEPFRSNDYFLFVDKWAPLELPKPFTK